VAHLILLLLSVVLSANTVVHGYSDGAGDCPVGEDPRLAMRTRFPRLPADRPVTQLSLGEAGLRVTINDFDLMDYYATTAGASNGGVEAAEEV